MKTYTPKELRAAEACAIREKVNLNVFLAEHEKTKVRFHEHMRHVETLLSKGLTDRASSVLRRFPLVMFREHPMLRLEPENLTRLLQAHVALGLTEEEASSVCLAREPVARKRSKEEHYVKERLHGYRLPVGKQHA